MTLSADTPEGYLLNAANTIMDDFREQFIKLGQHPVGFFDQATSDKTILGVINYLLRETGNEPIEPPVKYLWILEAKYALLSYLRCKECNPDRCDGFKTKLFKRPDGEIISYHVMCPVWLRDRYIALIEEKLNGKNLKKLLGSDTDLEKLPLKTLAALYSQLSAEGR